MACGYASQYNVPSDKLYGIRNTNNVAGQQLTWRGVDTFDESWSGPYRAAHQENVGRWISEGSLHVVLDETKGIDNGPQGLIRLFSGGNVGKAILDFDAL